jgi:glycosyltransferase involved in cell wall biosynthesis
MPAAPWFVCGPVAWVAAAALRRGPEQVVPTPAEDWRQARVDLVIAACRDQPTIIHCLAGIARQTLPPRRILLVDDGGAERDHGIQLAREFARANGMDLQVVQRTWSIGKAATLKRQARSFLGDVLFVLDGNAVLASPDYVERCVHELYQGVGIASVCGTVEPLRPEHRHALARTPAFQRWLAGDDYRDPLESGGRWARLWRRLGDDYRAHIGRLQQGFIDRGLMCRHGGVDAPSGEAIAYRRRYLKDMFDRYEPIRGDDLTAVEDLFIARALATEGYRNVRLADVHAQVQAAPPWRLPWQAWRWAIALLQNDHYFDPLLRSPLYALRHRWREWRRRRRGEPAPGRGSDQRRIREAYRQPFGERLTRRQGRPVGTALLLLALERVGYPVTLLVLGVAGAWGAFTVVAALEILGTLLVSACGAPGGRRVRAVLGTVLATPVRYALIAVELVAVLSFALLLWPARRLRWHVQREVEGVGRRRA